MRGHRGRQGPRRLPGGAGAPARGALLTRTERLAETLGEHELDGLLVSDLVNLRYLTGFTGTSGLAVIGAGGDGARVFITDFRYVERAAAEVEGYEQLRGERELLASVAPALPDRAPLRLGFDDAHLPVRRHARLREALPEAVDLVAAGGLVEALRMVKDPGELARIRAAAELADDAFRATLEGGLKGRTERAVALELEDRMRRDGAEPSFPSIIAAGAHGALPHAEPRDVEIPADALVVVDWGARLQGYCSDCTRTVATGSIDGDAAEVYELVRRAQAAALAAVRPGPSGREVDAVARELIAAAGHGERFGHGLGHGVGLEVHEGPRLAASDETALRPGNVVTVEPGVYLPGRFGVRIEDLVAVTAGGTEVFSGVGKELLEID
ncbi:MAG: Xaa-Pro peptidase family protein [Actinomycetota bacterium]|nr:Xaa-Pro peptidase family protein [Actinomycetota bacterium]